MDQLLTLLTEQSRILAADVAAITENYRAMNAMGDDVIVAVETRGHREFSLFTPPYGRS